MIIVVQTGNTESRFPGTGLNFYFQIIRALAYQNPDKKFKLTGLSGETETQAMPSNVEYILSEKSFIEKILGRKMTDTVSVSQLKKLKADLVICMQSSGVLKTEIPQFHFVSDSELFVFSKIKTACSFGFFDKSSRDIFINRNHASEEFCFVIYAAPSDQFRPFSNQEKSEFKKQITDKTDYFFVFTQNTAKEKFIELLKAFSGFKKRQKSGLKILFSEKPEESISEEMKTYKYRNDVLFLENPGLIPAATASSYGVIILKAKEADSVMFALSAMKSSVPVLSESRTPENQFSKNVYNLKGGKTGEGIADEMMRLYADEAWRSELIRIGNLAVKEYTCEKTAEILWKAALKTVG